MPYCHVCGTKLPDNALFCPNCGTKVAAAAAAGASTAGAPSGTPSDEIRDAFNRMSIEMEKAFNIAAKEVQTAFETARDNIQKSMYKTPIVCPNCGEKNPSSADYCYKCGAKLTAPSQEPNKDNKTAQA